MRSSLWRLLFIGCLIGWGYNGNIVKGFCCLSRLAPILEQWLTSEGIITQKSDGEELNVLNHPIQDANSVPIRQVAISLRFLWPTIGNVLITTACPPFGKFLMNGCFSLCLGGMKACYDRCAPRRRRVKSQKEYVMRHLSSAAP